MAGGYGTYRDISTHGAAIDFLSTYIEDRATNTTVGEYFFK
jgi:hypothetical protein